MVELRRGRASKLCRADEPADPDPLLLSRRASSKLSLPFGALPAATPGDAGLSLVRRGTAELLCGRRELTAAARAPVAVQLWLPVAPAGTSPMCRSDIRRESVAETALPSSREPRRQRALTLGVDGCGANAAASVASAAAGAPSIRSALRASEANAVAAAGRAGRAAGGVT